MQEATLYPGHIVNTWEKCSSLERVLLQELARGTETLFSQDARSRLANKLGICELTISLIQTAIRALQRKGIVAPVPDRGVYYLDDFQLKNWVLQEISIT